MTLSNINILLNYYSNFIYFFLNLIFKNFLVLPSFIIFINILLIFFISKRNTHLIKITTLIATSLIFIFYLSVLFFLNDYGYDFFFVFEKTIIYYFNLNLVFGIDNISLMFLLLISLIFMLSTLISWDSIKFDLRFFFINLLFLELMLLNTFMSLNLFFFYFFFEFTLLSMFFMIVVWGSRQRKIHAVYMFFFYTVVGSIFLLLGTFYLYYLTSSLDIRFIDSSNFSVKNQIILWLLLFLGFSIKIPMVPFHIWLPEAHVEAPTVGSIILAGILLKIGSYGMLRFIVPLFPYGNKFFLPLVYIVSVIAIIYISWLAIRQVDLKKIIAYSSIAHMSFVTLGLFSNNVEGLVGSVFLMLSHGFVSSALFVIIGCLYDRYSSRLLTYYGGLVNFSPILILYFFFFTLANVSFPGTSSFIGEFSILLGVFEASPITSLISCFSIVLSAVYSFWLYNRVSYGNPNNKNFFFFKDLNKKEFFVLFILFFFTLFFGLYPNCIVNKLHLASVHMLN